MDSVRAFVLHTLCEGEQSLNSLVAEFSRIPALVESSNFMDTVKVILNEFCVQGLAEVTSA